jgi:hemoglobin/transferrin/lactoferrin receptor protein
MKLVPSLLVVLTATAVRAQQPAAAPAKPTTTPPASEIPEVVVTATRNPVDPHNVPLQVDVVDQERLQRELPRSLPEALLEVPGVNVQKTSNGQGSPYIRGFTGFRNLAMIDGVRFNNSTFREGPNEYWNTIDFLSLERLELVQGQGSVLYGSDAIGGTLNLISQGADFMAHAAGESFITGSTFHRYSTAEDSYIGRIATDFGVGGKWGLHLGATLKEFGDVRAADLGRQPFTGYSEWSYDVRFDARLSDQWDLTVVHQQLQQDDAWRTHNTIFGVSFAGTEVGTDLRRSFDHDRTLSYTRLSGHDLDSWVDRASLTVSYQTGTELQDRIRNSLKRDISGFDIDTWGIDLQLESDTPIGRLVYGMDYYHDQVDSQRRDFNTDGSLAERRIQGAVGDDASYDLLGVYVQDEIALGQRTQLFLGGRYTYAQADIGRFEDPVTGGVASFADEWDNFVASARIQTALDEKDQFKLYGGVSQGFRAPNLSDLSRLDVARSGELETAGRDLDPEKFINYEIGLKARTDRFTGSLAYFYTDIRDMITRQPTGRIIDDLIEVSKANASEGFVNGVEFAGSYELDKNWVEGDADAYPSANVAARREPLAKIQPVIGTAGVRWTSDTGKVWTELVCTAASRADRLNSADIADTQRIPPGGNPSWTLLGLRSGWQVSDNLTLLASLENLLDEAYRTHGSGSNEPGFGASLAVKVTF